MQKNKMTRSQTNKQGSLPFSKYTLMLPAIMGLFLSLIVYGYAFRIRESFIDVTIGSIETVDVFLHGKQIALYCAGGVALFLLLCFKLLNRKIIYAKKWMIPGGIYLLFSMISAVGAKDIGVAFFGGQDLFQGFWVLLAYMILFYYVHMIFCAETKQSTQLTILLLRSILILALLLSIIGILQMCGHDPFSWEWVQRLCHINGAQIIENKKIYLTLYNSNYVGVMMILLLPMLGVGIFIEKIKGIKLLYTIAVLGMMICLWASGSKAALIILVVVVVLGSVFIGIYQKGYRKAMAGLLIVVLFLGSLVGVLKGKELISANRALRQWKYTLTGLETQKDCVRVEMNGQALFISWNNQEINVTDTGGKRLETEALIPKKRKQLLDKLPPAMTGYYGESAFAPLRVTPEPFRKVIFFPSGLKYRGKNIRGYVLYLNRKPYFITKEWKQGEYYYYNLAGRFVRMYDSQDAFGTSIYGLASYRGYIWSKTLPLLKQTAVFGVGMDHFSLLFPNHDYAAKARINKTGVVYNKPHNWYLQMATQSGVIGAIGMVVMLLMLCAEGSHHIRSRIKRGLAKNRMVEADWLQVGTFISIIGYCFMSLFNDSMLVTAPVFWVIAGAYAGTLHQSANGDL